MGPLPILKMCLICVLVASNASVLLAAQERSETALLKIRAVLFDRDLNQKPLPKMHFAIKGERAAEPVEIVTTFDGLAEMTVPVGNYRVVSLHPVDFQGRRYGWDVEVKVPANGTTVDISNDNATITDAPAGPIVDDLTSIYRKYQASVVTVLAEYGPAKGTGFFIDTAGLILTNQHVVRTSAWVAVQVDGSRRLSATVLATDPEKDIAVLWVNLAKVPDISAVTLLAPGQEPAVEGEKVFTIGSPLHQTKVMTTGIVSKVEKRVIISDININHGNSGGPLFNSRGTVIGITTFGDTSRLGGPGISGVVRIEESSAVIDDAKIKLKTIALPSPDFLPCDPQDTYPLEAIKRKAQIEKFDSRPYIFGVGDYDVAVITPVLRYREFAGEVRAKAAKEKRTRKSQAAVQNTFQPLDDLKGWQEYVGEYEPVIIIQASPKLKEGFWSAFGRGMAASNGNIPGPASLHFKTDFYKMKLLCGSEEVLPLMPGKAERVLDVSNSAVRVTDATFDGLYKYPSSAIRPDCGKVTLQLFSEKEPDKPKIKELDSKTVNVVFNDFEPYRAQKPSVPSSP